MSTLKRYLKYLKKIKTSWLYFIQASPEWKTNLRGEPKSRSSSHAVGGNHRFPFGSGIPPGKEEVKKGYIGVDSRMKNHLNSTLSTSTID
ncbi:MAG: hypothetical protein KDD53_04260 [Bdellovibrionales bacterium]|nr:hypothetical protein [Bdellovibrionales bacterium]